MELVWIPSTAASCFHAAASLIDDRQLLDAQLAESLRPAVAALVEELSADGISRDVFWDHLVPLSTAAAGSHELARVVLTKTVGANRAESMTPRFANNLSELSRVYSAARPRLADELPQRSAPLEQQWRARGPGMLSEIARLTDDALIVDRAEVLLVEPVLGGGGQAHVLYNSVRIEAVLANPDDRLPEAARLAWLLALLNLELSMFSERIHRDRLRIVAPLAMLPVVLSAAEYVELAHFDAATMALAIHAWRTPMADDPRIAQTLLDWWQTYLARRPAWAVALAALDEMLRGTSE